MYKGALWLCGCLFTDRVCSFATLYFTSRMVFITPSLNKSFLSSMQFAAFFYLFISAFAAPTPAAADSNYKLLTNSIIEFQSNSDYSWQLIMTALSQEKALLNSFSTSAVGNLTLFLPSDAGFLNLNLASLSQNDHLVITSI